MLESDLFRNVAGIKILVGEIAPLPLFLLCCSFEKLMQLLENLKKMLLKIFNSQIESKFKESNVIFHEHGEGALVSNYPCKKQVSATYTQVNFSIMNEKKVFAVNVFVEFSYTFFVNEVKQFLLQNYIFFFWLSFSFSLEK